MLGYLVIFALFLAGVAAFSLRAHNVRPHTTAEAASFGATLGGELGRFVAVLNSVNNESDQEYVAALERARSEKETILTEAARAMESSSGLFALRHSVVVAVSALRDPSALDFLGKVALNPQPLPPREALSAGMEPQETEHDAEQAVQGTTVALDALDGIERLADDGHAAALDLFVEAARIDSNAIRGVALTALAARAERREHLQRALSELPLELRALAGLRRRQVHDIPQIRDPRVHLAGEEQGGPFAPPLPEDMEREARPRPDVHGAPLVPRR